MNSETIKDSAAERPPCGDPAIRVEMLPRDANKHGTIFGGAILSYLDLAGDIEARRNGSRKFVTVAIRGVEFIAPVFVGDLVSFYTRTLKVGRTSVTVEIIVEARRDDVNGECVRVMEAEAVYVAVDENQRPIPVKDQ
ncbi:MAG TPA: hotdog domain-containing protein [Blastocatellia bacterium]|nr:hotdog domain-containing protein [Blastocatellia bacterium]